MLNPFDGDAEVREVLKVLGSYESLHPNAKVKSYRQNSQSIRIRIIDPDFRKLDKALRHDHIWEILEKLPEDIQSQITVLLLLSPEETQTSFANMDFENPIPSRL